MVKIETLRGVTNRFGSTLGRGCEKTIEKYAVGLTRFVLRGLRQKVVRALGLKRFTVPPGFINSLLKSTMNLEKQIGKKKFAYIDVGDKKIRVKEIYYTF